MIKEKTKFDWNQIDTNTLMDPSEILAYHINRYLNEIEKKAKTRAKKDLAIVSSYLTKERLKEMGVGKCSRMK